MCAMNVGIVMPNLAALRAAVFTLSGKNLRGGGGYPSPPVGARVKIWFKVLRSDGFGHERNAGRATGGKMC